MRITVLCFAICVALWCPSYKATSAVRCIVQPKSVEDALKKSAAVFVGEVIEVNDGASFREARLRVEQSWKGVETREVMVLAPHTAESPRYQVAERYLVFAKLEEGKLITGNCSRTKPIKRATEDLQQLGPGKVPSDSPSDAESQRVCVIGDVLKPSAVSFKSPITLMHALKEAGGVSPGIRNYRVTIMRTLGAEDGLLIDVNVKAIKNGTAKDITLEDKDIVSVMPKGKYLEQPAANAAHCKPCGCRLVAGIHGPQIIH